MVRRAGQCPGRGSELYVQPTELASKLIREMEDHKVSRAGRTLVPNRYTIFLCSEDHEHLRERREVLIGKLERHLAKHIRAKKYDAPAEVCVDMVLDKDLKFGHFGILAEWDAAGPAEQDELRSAGREGPLLVEERAPGVRQSRSSPPVQAATESDDRSPAAAVGRTHAGPTQVIRPGEAAHMGLAWQTLIVRAGNEEREFAKGHVIVGRGRDVDFRVDDPNVSRRHAAIFWSDGKVMVEDLGSTNGTMVNGYPVSSTVVRPGDVIVIGNCRITVEAR